MDSQDYSDSSDENDSDYKPPGEDEKLSEVDSDDPIEDDEDSASTSAKKSKRTNKKPTKIGKRGSLKKSKKIVIDDEAIEKTKEEVNTLLNSSEDDKKRLDALWEEFQRPITKKSSNTPITSENKSKSKESIKVSDKPETTKKRNFEALFESSESSKKVENNDDSTTTPKSPETKSEVASIATKPSGGLANILSQIGKKSKLTVLEKSKLDWDGYKKKEGIVEELVTYNKGKDGYLEKQDFLERTDLRQFELEKALRAANRSHRS
ncbi:craniofacial development protein 1 [Metopolophium dirhodum]|uniref:craniofacial development protein 1 n=1 Tax=Metopolophium dirhodum TaxID=44670 RepID=UPI00299005CD|nr:craniofacial development protein 1 [Metopolophium dirhodum]XP_060869696.1 craniofacial development protein 1 [Metopolophium dirhodum]XP_060869697.1 craniofacial development protein 1 [Metopolophium dirhodum]